MSDPKTMYKFFYAFTHANGKIAFLCTASGPVEALKKEKRYREDVARGAIKAQEWDLHDRIPGETHKEWLSRVKGLFDVKGNGTNRAMQKSMLKQAAKKYKEIQREGKSYE